MFKLGCFNSLFCCLLAQFSKTEKNHFCFASSNKDTKCDFHTKSFIICGNVFLPCARINLNIEKVSELDKFGETSLIDVGYGQNLNFLIKFSLPFISQSLFFWSQIKGKTEFGFRLDNSLSTPKIFNMGFSHGS